jgi:hypothetical protein
MMVISNNSLFSVQWDLRAIWHILSGTAQAYLMALLCVVGWATLRCAQAIRFSRQLRPKRDASKDVALAHAKHSSRIDALQQLLLLMILLLGAVLANEVFGSLTAVQNSRFSLSEYHIDEALQVPAAFAFLSTCAFLYVHGFCWIAQAYLPKKESRNQ